MKLMGSPIQVDGVRPKWLADDDKIQWSWPVNGWVEQIVSAKTVNIENGVLQIRLPEDHFAYTAIGTGFEPWAGGDAAPDDWDDKLVLLSNGKQSSAFCRGSAQWSRNNFTYVIGYKKRVDPVAAAEPATQPDTDPTVALLTEIRDLLKPTELAIGRGTFSFARYTHQPELEPLTITITGPQGSGKTRWAELISNLPAALLGFPVPVVVDGEVVS